MRACTGILAAFLLLAFVSGCGETRPPVGPVTYAPTLASNTATAISPSPIPPATPTPLPLTSTPEPAAGRISFIDSDQRLGQAQSWDLALADLDDDGDLDAFVANAKQGGATNGVWLNDGQGGLTPGEPNPGYGQGLALADLDGDGDLDAVVASWWGEEASRIWLNDGSGTFADSGQNLGAAMRPAVGDLDGDGDPDILLARLEANTVWFNDGRGAFDDSGQRLGTGITAGLALGDLDGDGDLDALAGGWEEAAKVWLNNGAGTFSEHRQNLSPPSVHVHGLALGDLDNDGDLDAFMAVASGDPNQVWFNDGSGAFSDSAQSLHSSLAHGVALGDLDGDGDLDALTAHGVRGGGSSGGKLWLNDGLGQFSRGDITLGSSAAASVALQDLDGDGDLDAFVAHGQLWMEKGGELPNAVWLNESVGGP